MTPRLDAPEELLELLLGEPKHAVRIEILQQQAEKLKVDSFAIQLGELLKGRADHFLHTARGEAESLADLILWMAETTANPLLRGLGLRARGNIQMQSEGDFGGCHRFLEEAAQIYLNAHRPVEWALTQRANLICLAEIERRAEAAQIVEQARLILQEAREILPLIGLLNNWAVVHERAGEPVKALEILEEARHWANQLPEQNVGVLGKLDNNRQRLLRLLGRLNEALQCGETAYQDLIAAGQSADAARARHNQAYTFLILGQYNHALQMFAEARQHFQEGNWQEDQRLVDLDTSECLLRLRRFEEALAICQQMRYSGGETTLNIGQAILSQGVAQAGLAHRRGEAFETALETLSEAQILFARLGNRFWETAVEREIANIYLYQQRYPESLALGEKCTLFASEKQLPIEQAQGHLIAGQAARMLGDLKRANQHIESAVQINSGQRLAWLAYQIERLQAQLARQNNDPSQALQHTEAAIQALESLRGGLMVEHRVDFLEDKQAVYEEAVQMYLETGQVLRGLEYAERAKSRALLDLLAHEIELRVQSDDPVEQLLAARLEQLKAQRNEWYRLSEERSEDYPERQARYQMAQERIPALELEITQTWHDLLVHNADYAQQADLWRVQVEPVQPYLDDETILIEYFSLGENWVAFMVTRQSVQVYRLLATSDQLQNGLARFTLNREAARQLPDGLMKRATQNAQAALQELYKLLVAPLADALAAYPRWIIVPHRQLHYLPFHALYDGHAYLLEKAEISYLPSASMLRYCQTPASRRDGQPQWADPVRTSREGGQPQGFDPARAPGGMLAFGHSGQGQLPFAVREAEQLADLMGGTAYTEAAASLERFYELAPHAKIIHIAAHGQFHSHNPLFSGLHLADGQLTTLDIFGLRLSADLVTLSACDSGQHQLGSGDELLGLARAFLYARATSLALSLWAVEDQAAWQIMEKFYIHLKEGKRKSAALRLAQLQFIEQAGDHNARYGHPFYWASFILVGGNQPV